MFDNYNYFITNLNKSCINKSNYSKCNAEI